MAKTENNELKLLEKAASEFSRKILAPEREENDKFPFGPFYHHVLDKAFKLDFFHIRLPEDLGGMGHSVRAFCTVMDNICREDSSLGGVMFTNALAQDIVLASGGKQHLSDLHESSDGALDFLMAFPSLTNPGDLKDLPTARQVNGSYHLSGPLDYLVLGGIAKKAVIPARIDGNGAYSYFLVTLDESTVTRSEPIMSHGLHACPAVDVTFSSTQGDILGEPGQGDDYFRQACDTLQLVATAMSLGVMKGSLKEALTYCGNRSQGGRKLKDWSAMQMMLADMTIQTQVADMLVSRACQAVEDQEKDWKTLVQAASLHVQSTAAQMTTDGIQALGGVGYMKDFGQEKRFRDAGQIQAMLGHTHVKKLRFIREMLN